MEICRGGTRRGHPKECRRTRASCSDRGRKRVQRERERRSNVTQREAIRLYCGIGEVSYSHHPIACGSYGCVSPVYGRDDREHVTARSRRNRVYVPQDVLVIQDSGAFSDGPQHRVSYAEALQRQIEHAKCYKYASQVTHRASYDLLIDETWNDAFRHKQRWSEEAGTYAVEATVEAAAYLAAHRSHGIGCILSAQGVTATQYRACVEKVLPYMDVERDIFGLGGFCILGKQPSLLPTFRETMQLVIPLLALHRVKRVHIWGVCFAKALGELLWWCDRYHLRLSTDSVGPSTRPIMGEWGYGSWHDPSYRKPSILASCKMVNASGYKAPTCLPGTPCLGLERARHVALTREWLAHFREREPNQYRSIARPLYRQLSWIEKIV